MKKKKFSITKLGIILTAISGTILSISTAGILTLPAVILTTASITGAIGTGLIVVEREIKKNTIDIEK